MIGLTADFLETNDILRLLVFEELPVLVEFDISKNPSWFSDTENFELILQFLRK